MTYPPEEVLLGGRVEDLRYLQVGVHAEPVLGGAGGAGPVGGSVRFVPVRGPRLGVRVLLLFQTRDQTNRALGFILR